MSDVRRFISDLHASWPEGDLERLAGFYHPDVVLLPPDLGEPIQGREAVVASYQEFLNAAHLERFVITGLEVFPFEFTTGGVTHMAHLNFEIDYELGGDRYIDNGLEVYAILDEGGQPSIIWRSQTILDSRLAEKSDPGE
jgi:hypothetical protein